MTPHEIQRAPLLDLLFEGRNKMYGAYALRRDYTHRLRLALLLGLGAPLALLLTLGSGSSEVGRSVAQILKATPVGFSPPPDFIPPPPVAPSAERAAPQARTERSVKDIRLVQEVRPDHELPTADMLTEANVGSVDAAGAATDHRLTAPPAPVPPVEEAKPAPETPHAPDVAPSFPGGMQAWRAFLMRHLQSPEGLEAGERRKVLVRFQVDATGTVSSFEVLQSAGPAFDGEVLRVMKKMPRWTPAQLKGAPVATTFTQPVLFEGGEE